MTSTVLAQITDELGTNLSSDRELHLIKSAHRIIDKNLNLTVLTDRNDTYHRYVHRLMNITFLSLEKSNADIRLAAEAYFEHILKAYECYGYPETSLKLLAMSIERLTGARQVTKVIKYLSYYLDILPRQRTPEKSGRTFHQEVVKTLILRSLDIDQTICHQALEKSCDKLISAVIWQMVDLKEIAEKTLQKLWNSRGHASRTMAALLGAVMDASGETFKLTFHFHLEKVIDQFVSNKPVPVGAISLIKRCFGQYAKGISQETLQGSTEMLLLMIRDSSNEVAYDAFAALEELLKADCSQLAGFVPGRFLRRLHGSTTSESEEAPDPSEFVDPLMNADLYEELQETLPPPKVDLFLEAFAKITDESSSVNHYAAAFLGKHYLLTGHGRLLKTDRQSKDSMKILAIRVLNVICAQEPLNKFIVKIGDKSQHLIDIIEYSTSSDDQLSQQAIKLMFLELKRGVDFGGLDCLAVFKSVKKYRYLLESVTIDHMDHLHGTELLEFLEIMAFRSLHTAHYDLGIPEITSACSFMGVIRDWMMTRGIKDKKYKDMIIRFQDFLKICINECWNLPRFVSAVPSFLTPFGKDVPIDDQYPPSLPLRMNLLTVKRPTERGHDLQPNNYDDWRGCLLAEASMPTIIKMKAILRENIVSAEYMSANETQWSRMQWNSDVLPPILQLMAISLADDPSPEDCYHGFHVGMSILNWVYRNVFIVRGAAETKEFPFLQHSRIEMDNVLGNRAEFRALLDAYYKTVQSAADEKLEQLLTPTVNMMMAAMERDFKTSTDNVLEIIAYIKTLFTLSSISALKLLHALLRSLLNPKLIESLTRGKVFYFESSNTKTFSEKDEYLVEAIKCKGDKYFNHWGEDMDVENVRMGAMTEEIMEQLEPLITQSLKCFRFRGNPEKEQVLQIMICLMNHKLKLSDADPTDCLMKLAVSTFARPEECIDPQLFETLMHFLATATRFQVEERYQKPITAATMLMKAIGKLSEASVHCAMKAVSFAVHNGRFEGRDVDELLKTPQTTWNRCMSFAPTETLYTLSLLLEKNGSTIKNKELFWTTLSKWLEQNHGNDRNVPFPAIAFPVTILSDYLLSDEVNLFEKMDQWLVNGNTSNIQGRCIFIAALYFSREKDRDWRRYLKYVLENGKGSQAAEYLLDYADRELIEEITEEDLYDPKLEGGINDLVVERLRDQHFCGSYQDLCHSIICLGEASVLDFIDIVEKEWPYDDWMWALLVSEFQRLDDDPEHRLDLTYRLQDLAESLAERFNSDVYLKFLANTENAGLDLSCLNMTQVKFILDQATPGCLDKGYVLRGVRNLIYHPRMAQLIAEDELGTAKMLMKLAENVSGIPVNNALLASYSQYRVDFHVKGEMDDRRVREIKKLTQSIFAISQEVNLRNPKKLPKALAACFRHPILNSIFNIPIVAMKCFNWIPVVEILRKPSITCLPPTGHVCDVIVLDDMRNRLRKVGFVTNAQFEVLFTTMQAVIAHTVIGPEKLDHDTKDAMEREERSCNALQMYIATILNSMKYPIGGDPYSGFVLKSPYTSELFLKSSEFAHLCNLKSAWKCEPRTAFTTPLERHDQLKWRKCDGKTERYGICQTPLFSLWQLCGMMPIEFKQHANYHRIDHSASNYFLTSATNIDTISNVKQLMNIFEYWYSQGIDELGENLLYTILQSILHLSDFFDDPDLHKAVLRTTSIIYRREYDLNPLLASYVYIMFLKSISVLGADMNGLELKPGELEAITMKLVIAGLGHTKKVVRIHTLAGLLYLVQSDSYESFMPSIDLLSTCLERYLKKLANGTSKVQTDETQFVLALVVKLLEVPIRLKQDKKTLLKLLLAAMRVRKDRFIIELIAEGIEQLLCRSNEFNGNVINFLLAGIESPEPIPFPLDHPYYCRAVYRILMVAATRAKVANDEMSMTRIYKALQKLGFDLLKRRSCCPAITRTLPFFSICINGVENTIASYIEAFMVNGNNIQARHGMSLMNQIVETAATSKKWTVELKAVREKMQSKRESLDEHNQLLLNILCSKLID
ncbi:hypothetical protein L3Y34_010757 [Caenorhabditis briggsae]|uniref:Uncharacterized protein n=2 Tax=Caenorhabditis briggsae TaxID=6238 RepID=A0AAE9CT33_CAEBR|nr:hypothetical protein L3Y34_010757 [Caenorhabditis briggsae]